MFRLQEQLELFLPVPSADDRLPVDIGNSDAPLIEDIRTNVTLIAEHENQVKGSVPCLKIQ